VRLPAEAREDGLGDLVDFLESLALRVDLSVEGETVRLAMSVGGDERRALAAACGAERLELDLDLDATRGAWRHMAALVEPLTPGAGFELEPLEPGRFVLAPESELMLRIGAAGQELTVSVPAGTRLEVIPGSLRVQKGRLVLGGAGATADLDVGEGRAPARRKEPRPAERHPLLRFYESATIH
jgi:hypothetical protein